MSITLRDDEQTPGRFKVVRLRTGWTIEDTRSGDRIGYFYTLAKAEKQRRLQEIVAKAFPGDEDER